MAGGKDKSKERRSGADTDRWTGLERRVHPDRRKVPRRAKSRRYSPRRLDERRSAGIGEVMDERRAKDRRRDERRRQKRRQTDRRTPPRGRRKADAG
jgi:hypothetical protein